MPSDRTPVVPFIETVLEMGHTAKIALFATLVFSMGAAPSPNADREYVFHHENVMGTSLELQVTAASADAARGAEERVLGEIIRLSAIFSEYDPQSEFSRWRSTPLGAVAVTPELFDVLSAADRWKLVSSGAFDPLVDAVSKLWARAEREGTPPAAADLAIVRSRWLDPPWRLDARRRTAERLGNQSITLNGISKGAIVELAGTKAFDPDRGIRSLVLNVGGDLFVRGDQAATVGVVWPWADSESTPPLAWLRVQNRAIATSGRSQRGFRVNGQWYSHLIDPRTGRPVERVVAATVIAPRSIDADAFAKVCNVLDPAESVKLAESLTDIDCLVVKADGRTMQSHGFARYKIQPLASPGSQPVAFAAANDPVPKPRASAPTDWTKDFELTVNFEINRPDDKSGPYRRPYVAIWVDDAQGKSVRTLALWVSMGGSGPFQWLPDLKRWFAADEARRAIDKQDLFFTISRPTRPPGKYRVIWDGKDDAGKPLPAGNYTITIEAAREHGTYQSIRKSLILADKPIHQELKGNVEIRSASIDYRRKDSPE